MEIDGTRVVETVILTRLFNFSLLHPFARARLHDFSMEKRENPATKIIPMITKR
jgi:hypothetical protein